MHQKPSAQSHSPSRLVAEVKQASIPPTLTWPCLLVQGTQDEADRLVFLGWPGQNEPEEEALNAQEGVSTQAPHGAKHQHQDSLANLNLACGMNAQLSQETAHKMSNRPIGSKQLT